MFLIVEHGYEDGHRLIWYNAPDVTLMSNKELLELSLQKWSTIVRYYERSGDVHLYDGGAETCALCQNYVFAVSPIDACLECPIAIEVNDDACHKTPYYHYRDAKTREDALMYAREMWTLIKVLLDRCSAEEREYESMDISLNPDLIVLNTGELYNPHTGEVRPSGAEHSTED